MKPPCKRLMSGKPRRFPRERDKDILRNHLRHAMIARLPECSREHQIHMPNNERAKGGFGAFPRERKREIAIMGLSGHS